MTRFTLWLNKKNILPHDCSLLSSHVCLVICTPQYTTSCKIYLLPCTCWQKKRCQQYSWHSSAAVVFEKKSKRNYLTHKWHVVFFPMWPTRQPHGIEIQRRPWTNILEWYVFCLIAAHAYYRFNRGMYSLLLHNGYWWKQKQSRRKTTSSECQAHRLEV